MSKNIIDSRDLAERLEELWGEFEHWKSDLTDEQLHEIAELYNRPVQALEEEDFLDDWMQTTTKGEEYGGILDLKQEIDSPEWDYGIVFIKDSYFVEYAEVLADDIGAINRDATWPLNHIDWESAANELKTDYCSAKFDGETYWYRA